MPKIEEFWRFNDACYAGDLSVIIDCVKKGVDTWGYGLQISCEKDDTKLINYFITKTRDMKDLNSGLKGACSGGHMKNVKLMIIHGASGWNEGLVAASEKGHMEIVKYMMKMGADADGFNDALDRSCRYRRGEVAHFLAKNGATDFDVYSLYNQGLRGDIMDNVIMAKVIKRKYGHGEVVSP